MTLSARGAGQPHVATDLPCDVVAKPVQALDRILHHAHIVQFKEDSYRLKQQRKAGHVPASKTQPLGSELLCAPAREVAQNSLALDSACIWGLYGSNISRTSPRSGGRVDAECAGGEVFGCKDHQDRHPRPEP